MKLAFGGDMKNSFRIAEISLGRPHWDGVFEYEYNGSRFEVQRFGAQFSVDLVKKLIENLGPDVDAFSLVSLPSYIKMEEKSYVHRQYLEIMGLPTLTPLCDGSGLREISNLHSLIKLVEKNKIRPEEGIFFPMALMNMELVEWARKAGYRNHLQFGDSYSILGLPWALKPFPGLLSLTKFFLNIANMKDLRNNTLLAESPFQKSFQTLMTKQMTFTQNICGDLPILMLYDENLEFLKGKNVITWTHHPLMEKEILKHQPRSVLQLFPEQFKLSPYMNYSLLDATIRLSQGRNSALSIEEWEKILSIDIEHRQVARKMSQTQKISTQAKISHGLHKIKNKLSPKPAPDFAFIVHALSHKDLMKAPGLKVLNYLPSSMNDSVDRAFAKLPPLLYGEVQNVVSAYDGSKVNGLIYGLFSTPRVLKETPPEIIYNQIQGICEEASQRGAQIIGLGAYTKIVGDQGITINRNSPIPVTTGNSLSASSTLWALYETVQKMGLLSIDPETGLVDGTAMVIGATGSIGKVSAKLLSLVYKKLVLVAPRLNRLEELKKELEMMSRNCEVIISIEADSMAHEVDALVTATSSFDHKIIDVEKLKPGCVVCDCSRPLDFDIEDAKKRPDVLIIESGEVILPGPSQITCDLGLPGRSVYACLAETALLAMEKRYEPFTMGRDIEWSKVKEIYKMARKHGVRLASIQGHMGTLTDKEIQLTKELALSRRRKK